MEETNLVAALAGLEIAISYVQFVEAKRAEDFFLAIRSVGIVRHFFNH
jgi:hypothetical protein